MPRAQNALAELRSDQRGAAFVEYVIVVGLVAIVCILAFNQFGDAVKGKVNQQKDAIVNMGSGK
jgi:Flp pilus assembly pilin Flp